MPPDLQVIAPSFLWGSGGHRTILNNAMALARRGLDVSILVDVIHGPETTLAEQHLIAESLVSESSSVLDIKIGWDRVHRTAPVMVTAAQSAGVLNVSAAESKFYFLQDRESFFNPAGWWHLNAELSYLSNVTRISIGKWIPAFLARDYGLTAIPTPFGVDHGVYSSGETARSARPRVAVVVQPDKPRRMTELLVAALSLVACDRPDVDIVFFGSNLGVAFDYPAKHLGLLPEASIARLYASSWLGICLSATNPSRVPFEMVASGLPVLDIFGDNTLYDYPSAVNLIYPGEKSLASAILSILEDPTAYQQRAYQDGPNLASRRDETESFAEIVTSALDGNPSEGQVPEPPSPTRLEYEVPPHDEEKLKAEQWLARTRNIAAGAVGRSGS